MAAALVALGACGHKAAAPLHPRAVELQAAGAQALARGELDRAAGQFALALEYEPRMAEAENGLGLVALRYGDRATAERRFHAALALDEDLAEAHLNLGGLLLTFGRTEEALGRFRAALAIDPGYAEARLAAGEALLRLGRLHDARWELAKTCEAAPENASAHAAHALVLARLGRVSVAEAAARRALELSPRLPAALRARAEILRRRGDLVGAEEQLRMVIVAEPESVDDRLALGTLLGQARRWDAAVTVLEAAALRAPRHPAVLFALAFGELSLGRPSSAASHARQALEAKPSFPEARYVLAEALFLLRDFAGARSAARAFLSESSEDMTAERARAEEIAAGGLPQ